MSMMGASQPQVPPWLQKQIEGFQKTQQEIQMIAMQKQQLEAEKVSTVRTLEELKKAKDDETVFKFAGSIMIKTTKTEMISEMEERQELAKTRSTVMKKQEERLIEVLKKQEADITQSMRTGMPPSSASSAPPPPPPPPPTSPSRSTSQQQSPPAPQL